MAVLPSVAVTDGDLRKWFDVVHRRKESQLEEDPSEEGDISE